MRYLPGIIALLLVTFFTWKDLPSPFDWQRLMPAGIGIANFSALVVLLGLCLAGIVMGCMSFWDFDKRYRARNAWAREVLNKKH